VLQLSALPEQTWGVSFFVRFQALPAISENGIIVSDRHPSTSTDHGWTVFVERVTGGDVRFNARVFTQFSTQSVTITVADPGDKWLHVVWYSEYETSCAGSLLVNGAKASNSCGSNGSGPTNEPGSEIRFGVPPNPFQGLTGTFVPMDFEIDDFRLFRDTHPPGSLYFASQTTRCD
jgi:hypothetical protein